MEYKEQGCCIEHEGRKFCAGGAEVTPEFAIGYFKANGNSEVFTDGCSITDWHGKVLGSAKITGSWPIRSYMGSRMYQVRAVIDGMAYTGRTLGSAMIWKGKRCVA